MLDQSALEIACHADVQISRAAGEDVNDVGAIHVSPANSRSLTSVRERRDRVRDDNVKCQGKSKGNGNANGANSRSLVVRRGGLLGMKT